MVADAPGLNWEKAAPINFLQQVGWSKHGFDQNCGKIVREPLGCGKTISIAILAQFYLAALGVAVTVLAGWNGSSDRSLETLDT